MMNKNSRTELFIGITSWNSAFFLGSCLDAVIRTTRDVDTRILVFDNDSSDRSAEIARERGIDVLNKVCSQGNALNALFNKSKSPYTLLLHADVILLSPTWFNLCRARLQDNIALVSPEDIGCGPLTRPFGKDKPESSFMFFATEKLARTRIFQARKLGPLPIPRRLVDFFGPHVTHRLPQRLADCGYAWLPMKVLYSDAVPEPIYQRPSGPGVWSDELRFLRYGLGNFYTMDGTITHYHNWYDRVQQAAGVPPVTPTGRNPKGFPLDYVKAYSERFLRDYQSGQLVLPSPQIIQREPKAL